MSYEDINRIYVRLVHEPAYREFFFRDRMAAVEGCNLTDAEIEAVKSFTLERLYEILGAMAVHQLVPVQVSAQFRVVPANGNHGDIPIGDIALMPGLVFGNGTHGTTRLTLECLESYIKPDDTVLDLGTGSGILAIAACKLGASRVLAADIDPKAVQAAQENIRLNGYDDRITLVLGSLGCARPGSFDLITANILPVPLIHLLQTGLGDRLKPGGTLAMCGIWRDFADEVETAGRAAGLRFLEKRTHNGWVSLSFRRKQPQKRLAIGELFSGRDLHRKGR